MFTRHHHAPNGLIKQALVCLMVGCLFLLVNPEFVHPQSTLTDQPPRAADIPKGGGLKVHSGYLPSEMIQAQIPGVNLVRHWS